MMLRGERVLTLAMALLLVSGCGNEDAAMDTFGSAKLAVVGWYDLDWDYRRPVSITNANSTVTNYTVLIAATFPSTHVLSDLKDLRVTGSDGVTPLPFFVERQSTAGGTTSAHIWVKLPSIVSGTTSDALYLYTGNSAAPPVANGRLAFDVYEGFEDYPVAALPSGAGYINPGEWQRYNGSLNGAILAPSSSGWDSGGSTFASVIWDATANGGEYRMYYQGWPSGAGLHQIGLATSPDGKIWTKRTDPVLRPVEPLETAVDPTWDNAQVRVPMVWKEGASKYKMIYTGVPSGNSPKKVGLATSTDGITWAKSSSNPVFHDSTSTWDGSTENFGVIKVGGEYLMWYSNTTQPRQIALAKSTNLTTWTTSSSAVFSTVSGTDRFSQFCPFTFKYGGEYYVLVPSYDSSANFAKLYLWRSSSPEFPSGNRTLVRAAHTVGSDLWAPDAWDYHDSDTPAVLTADIQRNLLGSDRSLWAYYSGEGPSGWGEGLHLEGDAAYAVMPAPLPPATGSVLSWAATANVAVASSTVRRGARSAKISDGSASTSQSVAGTSTTFASQTRGEAGAWMRRATNQSGSTDDFDIYIYGDGSGGAALKAVVGLGGNGQFHYWGGTPSPAFVDTGTSWSANTWYFVTIQFNAVTDKFNFIVYDTSMNIVGSAATNIDMGNPASHVNTATLYTSNSYVDTTSTFADEFRIRKFLGPEPTSAVGGEQTP